MNKIIKNAAVAIVVIIFLYLVLFAINHTASYGSICEGFYVREAHYVGPDNIGNKGQVFLLFRLDSGETILQGENHLMPKLIPGSRVKFPCGKGRFWGKSVGRYEPL